jgi:hypothetical protein
MEWYLSSQHDHWVHIGDYIYWIQEFFHSYMIGIKLESLPDTSNVVIICPYRTVALKMVKKQLLFFFHFSRLLSLYMHETCIELVKIFKILIHSIQDFFITEWYLSSQDGHWVHIDDYIYWMKEIFSSQSDTNQAKVVTECIW